MEMAMSILLKNTWCDPSRFYVSEDSPGDSGRGGYSKVQPAFCQGSIRDKSVAQFFCKCMKKASGEFSALRTQSFQHTLSDSEARNHRSERNRNPVKEIRWVDACWSLVAKLRGVKRPQCCESHLAAFVSSGGLLRA